jgi:hypothetical protein
VKPGATVELGSLGYAAAAIRSYEDFKKARAAGKLPASARFQVSLPTPLAVVLTFSEPAAVTTIWPVYEARLNREIDEIARLQFPSATSPSNGTSLPRFVSSRRIQG